MNAAAFLRRLAHSASNVDCFATFLSKKLHKDVSQPTIRNADAVRHKPIMEENAWCSAREALWNNVLSTVAKENDELFRRYVSYMFCAWFLNSQSNVLLVRTVDPASHNVSPPGLLTLRSTLLQLF